MQLWWYSNFATKEKFLQKTHVNFAKKQT